LRSSGLHNELKKNYRNLLKVFQNSVKFYLKLLLKL